MPEMRKLGKPNLCHDKYVIIEVQSQICPRYISWENLTRAKINRYDGGTRLNMPKTCESKKLDPCKINSL